jgi:hypothetical protein
MSYGDRESDLDSLILRMPGIRHGPIMGARRRAVANDSVGQPRGGDAEWKGWVAMKSRKPVAWIPLDRSTTSVLLVILVLAASVAGASAQASSALTIGTSTLTYTEDWELLGEDGESATLQHSAPPFTLFDYSAYPNNAMGTSDPSELIAATRIDALDRQDSIGRVHLAGGGSLPDGTVWELYTMEVSGTPIFYLIAANVDLVPGVDIVSSIATTMDGLVAAHFAVSQGITVDGGPTPIARIDVADVLEPALEAISDMDDPRVPVPPAGPAS